MDVIQDMLLKAEMSFPILLPNRHLMLCAILARVTLDHIIPCFKTILQHFGISKSIKRTSNKYYVLISTSNFLTSIHPNFQSFQGTN